MNSRVQGTAIGGGNALAEARVNPSLIQLCNCITSNINALRDQHLRINDAISRLQNPRPVPAAESAANHPAAQTLEGRLQEINRELEYLLNDATGYAARLDESV